MFDAPTADVPLVNLAYERAIVAAVLSDNAALGKLGALQAEDLTDPVSSAALARAMVLHADGERVNLVTLRSGIEGIRDIDGTASGDVLRSLTVAAHDPPVEDIAQCLVMLSRRRDLAKRLSGLAQDAHDDRVSVRAILGELLMLADESFAAARSEVETMYDAHEMLDGYMQRLMEPDRGIEITTGFADLDNAMGGWHRGQFVIVAGRPSMGKSAMILSSLRRTASAGCGVLFFSLEMTSDQVTARLLTDECYTADHPIAYANLRPGRVDDRIVDKLHRARARIGNLPLVVETANGLSMADIAARTRRVAERMKADGQTLSLVVIDHLLKVRPSKRYAGQPVKEIDEISDACCVLAKSQNVAVVALHQLNRGVESRENHRPVMSDLRGSGSLEQDADAILFVYRPAYALERQQQEGEAVYTAQDELAAVKHIMELQIAKQRNGPTTQIRLWCDMASNAIRNAAYR